MVYDGSGHLRRGAEDKLLKAVEERRVRGIGADGLRGGAACTSCCRGEDRGCNRDVVANEGVDHGIRGTDQELHNLQGRQRALDNDGHADVEDAQRVVGVLYCEHLMLAAGSPLAPMLPRCEGLEGVMLTIRAWMPELTKANIQIGADM